MLDPEDFERIPAFGPETGRPVAFLVGEMERPEQRRAVPMFSKCLTELKNLSRYVESTTVQNVIKSYFTAFVTSAMPSTEMFSGLINDDAISDLITRNPYHCKLGPGIINRMRPGDQISSRSSRPRKRPNPIPRPYASSLARRWAFRSSLTEAVQCQLFGQPSQPLQFWDA
jgi:capsid protein